MQTKTNGITAEIAEASTSAIFEDLSKQISALALQRATLQGRLKVQEERAADAERRAAEAEQKVSELETKLAAATSVAIGDVALAH